MTSTQAVRESLRELAIEFPSIRLRYQFDELAETHMVEVSPGYIYDASDHFKGAQARIIDEFVQEFPNEGLCFIGPNDVVGIEGEAEVFHGFWSEVQVAEPLMFTWPGDFIPAAFNTPATNWVDVFSFNPNDNEVHNPLFIQGSVAQSFMLPVPLVSFEPYDVVLIDPNKNDQSSEDSDYALAA